MIGVEFDSVSATSATFFCSFSERDGVEEPETESDCAPEENEISEGGSNRFSSISDDAPLQCKESESNFKTAMGQRGRRQELSTKAAATAHFQQHQQLHTGGFESAPDALASGAAANSIRKQAALLRYRANRRSLDTLCIYGLNMVTWKSGNIGEIHPCRLLKTL